MTLVTDGRDVGVQGFAPNKGKTYSGAVTVEKQVAVLLGSDVAISISGKSVTYSAGSGLILVPGVEYTFGTSVDCHIMD